MQPETINPNRVFYGIEKTNPVIDASSISVEQPQLNLPKAPQDTTDYQSIIGSVPTFENILGGITAEAPAEKTATSLMDRILGTAKSLGTKKARQIEEENKAGVPQFQTQLTDVSNQLQSLQKEALAIPLQLQQEATGRGITTGGLAPIQTGQLRQNAIKSLTLSAIGQTLQGNIANAQAQADRAIELEFAPQEQELATLKQAYEFNKDILERQDKKRADALNFQIQERERAINTQKEDRKIRDGFIAEAITTAGKNGVQIPTLVLQRASQVTNPQEALNMLSPYMVDTEAKANALLDRQIKQAQLGKIFADTQLTNQQRQKIISETVTDTQTAKAQLQNNEALTLAKELRRADATGKSGAVGFGLQKLVPFGQDLGLQPARVSFESRVNTLKSNLTLDNLKLLKGAMSDKDLLFLNSIGSSLNTDMLETEFDKELDRVIEKLEKAGATSVDVGVITAPDGTKIEIID